MKKYFLIALMLIPLMFFASSEFLVGDPLPDAPELSYRGEYSVGVRTIELVHEDRLDLLHYSHENPNPRYDRPLTVEIWYPCVMPENGVEKTVYFDEQFVDSVIVYTGRALKNAQPVEETFPLIIFSHGYPGTRFVMSYLTENLASKGYVVAAIEHTESTVRDQKASNNSISQFANTFLNHPLDILFTFGEIDRLSKDEDSFLFGLTDTNNVGLVGYSMGGYGIINVAGAGFSKSGVFLSWSFLGNHLKIRQSGILEYERSIDPRFKAIFALAPWGGGIFWDEQAMKGLQIPSFFVAGEHDDVIGYENGTRYFYDKAINSERYMLVFQNARHNFAQNAYTDNASVSAQIETKELIRFTEPTWDNRKLNNVVQHFATAFFGKYLKGQENEGYFDLIRLSNEGVWSQNMDGTFKDNHSYWKGFPAETALEMEFYSSQSK